MFGRYSYPLGASLYSVVDVDGLVGSMKITSFDALLIYYKQVCTQQ